MGNSSFYFNIFVRTKQEDEWVIYLKIFVTENRSDIEGKMLVMGVRSTPITSIFLTYSAISRKPRLQ